MSASAVDHAPERGKQFRHALDLVEYDEVVLVVAKKQYRIGEFGPILRGLKIEVDGRRSGRDGVGQGSLFGNRRTGDNICIPWWTMKDGLMA